ncbi:MAG: aldehyde-activating protein [Alphaproteobacteria bacterium]
MAPLKRFEGGCHCGNITVVLETRRRPDELGLRACQCSFCLSHGARSTSDPQGHARITVRDGARLRRYRFGLRTADFLVCRDCGGYAAAVMTEAGGSFAVLNVNLFRDAAAFAAPATPMSYDAESEAERRARRRRLWTPAEVAVLNASGG